MGRKPKSHDAGFFGRLFRSIFSIVILSALILGIGYFTKSLAGLTPEKFAGVVASAVSKLPVGVDAEKAGEVAGKFAERISQTDLGSGVSTSRDVDGSIDAENANVLFQIAIMSDIHEDEANLRAAFSIANQYNVESVIILGDITNFGDESALQKMRTLMDSQEIQYYIIPGDHDMAQSGSSSNFKNVFGKDHHVINTKGYKFLILNNSANFSKIETETEDWFNENLLDSDFVLLGQPLFTEGLNPPFVNRFMGSTGNEEQKDKQKDVLSQRDDILSKIRNAVRVKGVIAGDHHKSSSLPDAVSTNMTHYVIGAVSSTVNDYPQDIIQTPRFSILTIFDDGDYALEDVVIESEQ